MVKTKTTALAQADPKAKLEALVKRAEHGDQRALAELRPIYDADPALWETYDLARQARLAWIKPMAGDDLLFGAALQRQAVALRDELAGPTPSRLEHMLAERIVVCWLQVQYADALFAQNQGTISLKLGDYQQRRQDRAASRYLAAIKTIASICNWPEA